MNKYIQFKKLIIPTLNVNDDKVTIWDLRFNNLDFVNEGDILYSVESSKAVEDYETDFSGYVVFFVEDGDEVTVGKSVGTIFKNKSDAESEYKLIQENKILVNKKINASKKAIDYAKSIGFDILLINKDGIIKVEDIVNFLNQNK